VVLNIGSIFLVLGVVTTFEVDLKVKGLLNELFSSHDLWLHVVWHSSILKFAKLFVG
jgi:hypothetical protein